MLALRCQPRCSASQASKSYYFLEVLIVGCVLIEVEVSENAGKKVCRKGLSQVESTKISSSLSLLAPLKKQYLQSPIAEGRPSIITTIGIDK